MATDSVVALDLARGSGLDELVPGVDGRDGLGYIVGSAVGEVVVGDDPFDLDDVVDGEVVGGAEDEPGTGRALLVGGTSEYASREWSSTIECT